MDGDLPASRGQHLHLTPSSSALHQKAQKPSAQRPENLAYGFPFLFCQPQQPHFSFCHLNLQCLPKNHIRILGPKPVALWRGGVTFKEWGLVTGSQVIGSIPSQVLLGRCPLFSFPGLELDLFHYVFPPWSTVRPQAPKQSGHGWKPWHPSQAFFLEIVIFQHSIWKLASTVALSFEGKVKKNLDVDRNRFHDTPAFWFSEGVGRWWETIVGTVRLRTSRPKSSSHARLGDAFKIQLVAECGHKHRPYFHQTERPCNQQSPLFHSVYYLLSSPYVLINYFLVYG